MHRTVTCVLSSEWQFLSLSVAKKEFLLVYAKKQYPHVFARGGSKQENR
jgi:hypothetical protein